MKNIILAIILICCFGYAFAQTHASQSTQSATADSLSPATQFSQANTLLANKEYAKAITLYEGLNKDYPTWSCPWRHKGEAYYKLKNYPSAIQSLKQAIATNENHYDAYLWLAFAYYEQGEYQEAKQCLDKAGTLNPGEEGSADEMIGAKQVKDLYKKLNKKLKA